MPIARFDPDRPGTGDLYATRTNDVSGPDFTELWQVIGYITEPAAVLRNLSTGVVHVEVIGCLNAEKYVRLVPEKTL
jgi:hypothetical protein